MIDLEFRNVSYTYAIDRGRIVPAVDGIALTVQPAEVVALVGHNGAGKTTLMALAAGVLEPTSGSVFIDGAAASAWHGSGRIGFLTQKLRLFPRFSVIETLRVFARIQGLENEAHTIDAIIEEFGLGAFRDVWVGRLSTGLRKRLALAALVLGSPDVLLLDEPFAGLDPESVQVLMSVVRAQAAGGTSIIVASHDLPELECIADRIVVLREGRVVKDDSLENLRRALCDIHSVVIESTGGRVRSSLDARALIGLLSSIERRGNRLLDVRTEGVSLAQLYSRLHDEPFISLN